MPEKDSFFIKPLSIPTDGLLNNELSKLKRYLKSESARLQKWHREGASGREVCKARSQLLDILLQAIFEWTLSTFEPQKKEREIRISLVAIGGYGRAELNPYSDIDIMLLHNGSTSSLTQLFKHELIEKLTGPGGLIYTLYDLGMKVGHSVRNIQDAVNVANDDMQTKTSLIESRIICGDQKLFEHLEIMISVKTKKGLIKILSTIF